MSSFTLSTTKEILCAPINHPNPLNWGVAAIAAAASTVMYKVSMAAIRAFLDHQLGSAGTHAISGTVAVITYCGLNIVIIYNLGTWTVDRIISNLL